MERIRSFQLSFICWVLIGLTSGWSCRLIGRLYPISPWRHCITWRHVTLICISERSQQVRNKSFYFRIGLNCRFWSVWFDELEIWPLWNCTGIALALHRAFTSANPLLCYAELLLWNWNGIVGNLNKKAAPVTRAGVDDDEALYCVLRVALLVLLILVTSSVTYLSLSHLLRAAIYSNFNPVSFLYHL